MSQDAYLQNVGKQPTQNVGRQAGSYHKSRQKIQHVSSLPSNTFVGISASRINPSKKD